MMFFIVNWKAILASLISILITYETTTLWNEHKLREMAATCAEEKLKTKEANDELQKNLAAVRNKLAVNKLRSSVCIKPIEHSASGGQYAGQNGISSDWLREYAAECEIYRQEVISLSGAENK